MEDRNCEILFEYLRSIIYDTPIQKPDLDQLDPPYRKLGLGLEYLQHAVEEMLEYSAELSRGNLTGFYPSRDNFLCANLKNLHSNLNHLTWQAKQVAAGDYSQNVSYLGEFSEAFNKMTSQLKERDHSLREEAERYRDQANIIEAYNEMLNEKTRHLTDQAYHDAGTGIYNRLYGETYIDNLLKNHQAAILCYMDLDRLKYVNDNFGHLEGDAYLREFTQLIKKYIRDSDVFARFGGDEFIILFPGCPITLVESRMKQALDEFVSTNHRPYPVSFSYGIVEITADDTLTANEIIRNADCKMYACKRTNKRMYHNETK